MPNTILRRAAATATAALSLSLLTACDSGDGAKTAGDAPVASIAGSTPGKNGTSTASAEASRSGVQLRLDMTDGETDAIQQSYSHCLKDHGVPSSGKPWPGHSGEFVMPDYGADKYPAAYKACQPKKPIQPPELDPAKNPHYMDDFRAWIECMNRKGLKIDALPDGSGWNYSDHQGSVDPTSPESAKIEHKCQLEAYGAAS